MQETTHEALVVTPTLTTTQRDAETLNYKYNHELQKGNKETLSSATADPWMPLP